MQDLCTRRITHRRILVVLVAGLPLLTEAQEAGRPGIQSRSQSSVTLPGDTAGDYNERLRQLDEMLKGKSPQFSAQEYRIGPEDLLEISVFEAPELGRSVRVSASGEISMPLLGVVRAAGLTPGEMESVLAELLRRTYMKDPQVSVFVKEMQSHPVSVFGAVKKPGVFQVRGTKTLIEMLSMAEGLADDAGDTVLVMRHGTLRNSITVSEGTRDPIREIGPSTSQINGEPASRMPGDFAGSRPESEAEEINLKSLLNSGDTRFNVPVYPGDVVKVARAGIVYVVGEVKKPGGFQLKSNENISVLQAIALAEGLTRTSAISQTRIIRTDEASGTRREIPIHLNRILAGKIPDPMLEARDIVFVPNSTSRSALYRGLEAAISVGTGVAIYRR